MSHYQDMSKMKALVESIGERTNVEDKVVVRAWTPETVREKTEENK